MSKYLSEAEKRDIPAGAVIEDEEHAFRSSYERDITEEKYRRLLVECRDTAKRACQLLEDGAAEHDWQAFMEHRVFQQYKEGGQYAGAR